MISGSNLTFFLLRFINWKNRTEENKPNKKMKGCFDAMDMKLLGALLLGATGMQNIVSFYLKVLSTSVRKLVILMPCRLVKGLLVEWV